MQIIKPSIARTSSCYASWPLHQSSFTRSFTVSTTMAASHDAASAKHLNHYNTIIIGAGISGLACAAKLSDHEIFQKDKNLIVLEARDRIGGRIESVHVDGNRLDTGANWIHGVGTKEKPNPLVEILPEKEFKRLSRSVSFSPSPTKIPSDQDWVVVDASKSRPSSPKEKSKDLVIPSSVSAELFGSVWSLVGSLHESAANLPAKNGKSVSVLNAIKDDEEFKSAFKRIPEEYHQALRALPQFVEGTEAAPLNATSAEHSVDHPGMSMLEYAIDDFEGEQVFLKDGYTPVVEEVSKKLVERGQIKLGVQVHDIDWTSKPIGIYIYGKLRYTADRIICTIPLGVLQHHESPHSPGLFSPELPQEKKEAIRSLGFGTLGKIFLIYSSPWWNTESYQSILKKGITKIQMQNDSHSASKQPVEPDSFWGFTDELPGLEIDVDGNVTPGIRALFIVNLHALTGFPVLSTFVSCANAVHIEKLSNSAASMIVHRALTKWFGQEPPLPDNVYVTRWASDEFSRGSYSHMITNVSERKHREAFSKPVVNQHGLELRFAGEHTSLNHFATVHGALLSGMREADAVIKDEEKLSGESRDA